MSGIDYDDIVCPITHQIFLDPVIAADGHVYEKTALIDWFKVSDLSPINGLKIDKQFFPALKIKHFVDLYLKHNPTQHESQFEHSRLHLDNIDKINSILKHKTYKDLTKFITFDASELAKHPNFLDLLETSDIETFTYLTKNGNINKSIVQKDINTALTYLAGKNSNEKVKILIELGSNILHKNKYGTDAFYLSLKYGHLDTVKMILDRGYDVKSFNMTKYIENTNLLTIEIIDLLVNKGLDLKRYCKDIFSKYKVEIITYVCNITIIDVDSLFGLFKNRGLSPYELKLIFAVVLSKNPIIISDNSLIVLICSKAPFELLFYLTTDYSMDVSTVKLIMDRTDLTEKSKEQLVSIIISKNIPDNDSALKIIKSYSAYLTDDLLLKLCSIVNHGMVKQFSSNHEFSYKQLLGNVGQDITKLYDINELDKLVHFPNLREVIFHPMFNKDIDKGYFPNTVRTIIFGSEFNGKVHPFCLPENLTTLHFGKSFNKKFDDYTLPSSLIRLDIGDSYDHPIEGNLPDQIIELTLGRSYIHTINDDDLPQSIQKLTIKGNPKIVNNSLPNTITELNLIGNFNQAVNIHTFPENLEILRFGNIFNHHIDPNSLPMTLKLLRIGTGYKHDLDYDTLITRIEVVKVPGMNIKI